MVLDGTQQCTTLVDVHIESAPVWALHRIFKSIILQLELGISDEDEKAWAANLRISKSVIKGSVARWKIAGMNEDSIIYQNNLCIANYF